MTLRRSERLGTKTGGTIKKTNITLDLERRKLSLELLKLHISEARKRANECEKRIDGLRKYSGEFIDAILKYENSRPTPWSKIIKQKEFKICRNIQPVDIGQQRQQIIENSEKTGKEIVELRTKIEELTKFHKTIITKLTKTYNMNVQDDTSTTQPLTGQMDPDDLQKDTPNAALPFDWNSQFQPFNYKPILIRYLKVPKWKKPSSLVQTFLNMYDVLTEGEQSFIETFQYAQKSMIKSSNNLKEMIRKHNARKRKEIIAQSEQKVKIKLEMEWESKKDEVSLKTNAEAGETEIRKMQCNLEKQIAEKKRLMNELEAKQIITREMSAAFQAQCQK